MERRPANKVGCLSWKGSRAELQPISVSYEVTLKGVSKGVCKQNCHSVSYPADKRRMYKVKVKPSGARLEPQFDRIPFKDSMVLNEETECHEPLKSVSLITVGFNDCVRQLNGCEVQF